MEAGCPKSQCRQSHAPSGASREGIFLLLPASGDPGVPWLLDASLGSRLHAHPAFCLGMPGSALLSSYKDVGPAGLGPTLMVP